MAGIGVRDKKEIGADFLPSADGDANTRTAMKSSCGKPTDDQIVGLICIAYSDTFIEVNANRLFRMAGRCLVKTGLSHSSRHLSRLSSLQNSKAAEHLASCLEVSLFPIMSVIGALSGSRTSAMNDPNVERTMYSGIGTLPESPSGRECAKPARISRLSL